MDKCASNKVKILGFFSIKQKHLFIVTNVFVTLENYGLYDVVKTCYYCNKKEAFGVNQTTLMELLYKFPRAFNPLLLEYLKTWTR